MIALSFDQDWAPEWMTRALIDKCHAQSVGGTFFVTHECPTLASLATDTDWELAWHPNFLPGSSHGDGVDAVLSTMEHLVPDAKGMRAHGFVRGTHIHSAARSRGLSWDSSDDMIGHPDPRPHEAWNGLIRFPVAWADDVHLHEAKPFELRALPLNGETLTVVDFHPVHVALNSASLDAYQAFKRSLASSNTPLTEATLQQAAEFTNQGPGIATLFTELLSHIASQPPVPRLSKLAEQIRSHAPA